ncbi:DMT family transporter [Aulosira sp. FACHB-615]|uniref:DMT family transporter n=1 Tax=Aulosira sp. FACHB-615 TaxID=2692777 RepID=UPI0016885018|nr:EamA family transporter [Aulosira sp. FACHB-615]MBD2488725.1 DMT family transporter [Aulosira sp. FACHB-615]
MTSLRRWHRFIDRIPSQAYLWLAIVIFGASGAITRKLTEIGSQNLINGRNPISLCNVLFVGNICALLVLMLIYRQQWNKTALKQISVKNWLVLSVVSILSGALAPGLIFQALALTNVNNVILVGRLEPPLALALSIWLLKERVNLWEIVGAIAAFIGVTLTVILQPTGTHITNMPGFHLGTGEILAAVAAVAAAIATVIGKKSVSHIPLGIFTIYRTALGTVVFFFLALKLYGQHHFVEVFSPFLWRWMLLYSVVIVVLGQSLWFKGLRASTVSVASLVGSFAPIAGILAAYFILDEVPTLPQYIGGSLIVVGIFISQLGVMRQTRRATTANQVNSTEVQQVESEMGFKGI